MIDSLIGSIFPFRLRKDTEANCVYAGVPAKKLRSLEHNYE